MKRYALQYKPTSDLGRRFTAPSAPHFATREAADNLRLQCSEAESLEVVEVEDR